MPKVITPDCDQEHLLPAALEDWIGPRHPARLVRAVVQELLAEEQARVEDSRARFRRTGQGRTGRPAYSMALLLGLWLYGYMNQVRSSPDLEAAARDRLGFIWLCGNQAPDHNTLWRFWEANTEAFRATVRIALRLELVGLVLQAIDGTRLQAACSSQAGWDEVALGALRQRLEELGKSVGQARTGEAQLPLEPALGELVKTGQLRGAVLEILGQRHAGERQPGHPGEPEAHRVKLATGGKPLGYNGQAVVDARAYIITAADLTAESNDINQALPMMEQAEANTAGGSAEALSLADGGYATTETLRQAEQSGRALRCPCRAPPGAPNHASRFSYDPQADTVSCPQGQCLPFVRVRRRGRGQVPVRVHRSAAACTGCPVHPGSPRPFHRYLPGTAALERHRLWMASEANRLKIKLRKQIVEPVFGWLKSHDGFRRFTYRGLHKASAQWAIVCAARNLRTLAQTWFDAHSPQPVPAP